MHSRVFSQRLIGSLAPGLLLLLPAIGGAQNTNNQKEAHKQGGQPAQAHQAAPQRNNPPARQVQERQAAPVHSVPPATTQTHNALPSPAPQSTVRPANPAPSNVGTTSTRSPATAAPANAGVTSTRPSTSNTTAPANRPPATAATPANTGAAAAKPPATTTTAAPANVTGNRTPANTGTTAAGGITGNRTPNTGAIPATTSTPVNTGITGNRTPNTGTPANTGGITGSRTPNNAAPPANTTAPVNTGGITGNRPPNNAGTPANIGISFGNRNTPQRPTYSPGRGVQTTANPDGGYRHFNAQTQTAVHTDRGGQITAVERPGLRATNFRPDGRPAHMEQAQPDGSRMVVNRGVHGERNVEVMRADGVRLVSNGRRDFIERPLRPGYLSRTYVADGRSEVRVYRDFTYGRFHYATYVPPVYYQPGFYNWAYRPWSAPVYYNWGWGRVPWFFAGYFAPSPYYPSAALWLTDYVLAEDLQLAYQNQLAATEDGQAPPSAYPASSAALTPEIKQMISEEVQRQLAQDAAAAAQPYPQPTAAVAGVPPPALDARVRLFVVSGDLNLNTADGQTCPLTPGDIIRRTSRDLTPDGYVPIAVMVGKNGDCPAGFAAALDLATLQDMHNDFQAQIEAGLQTLATRQGRSGLPAGPPPDPRAVAAAQAQPAPDAGSLLNQLVQQAVQAETDIVRATGRQ